MADRQELYLGAGMFVSVQSALESRAAHNGNHNVDDDQDHSCESNHPTNICPPHLLLHAAGVSLGRQRTRSGDDLSYQQAARFFLHAPAPECRLVADVILADAFVSMYLLSQARKHTVLLNCSVYVHCY